LCLNWVVFTKLQIFEWGILQSGNATLISYNFVRYFSLSFWNFQVYQLGKEINKKKSKTLGIYYINFIPLETYKTTMKRISVFFWRFSPCWVYDETFMKFDFKLDLNFSNISFIALHRSACWRFVTNKTIYALFAFQN
jgi:hypothetical protein